MPWKLNDLTLGAQSSVENVTDGKASVSLSLALTPAERRQVEEMGEHAGELAETPTAEGGVIVTDTSPHGQNTVYLESNAPDIVDSGWFCIEDVVDDWRQSTTVNRAQLALKRIAGPDAALGLSNVVAEFLANDFSITDAKSHARLPTGARSPRRRDGTKPTVQYVPVGVNLLTNGDFEADVSGWTANGGAVLARDTVTKKVGAASLKLTRGGSAYSAYQDVAVVGGASYCFAAWAARGDQNAEMVVRWLDAAGAQVSEPVVFTAHAGTAFAYFEKVIEAPPNAATARVFLDVLGAGFAFFDAVTVRPCVPVVESPMTEPTTQGGFAGGVLSYVVRPGAHFLGDVRVHDMGAQTDATLPESSYSRVRGRRHRFAGDVLLENGVMRVWLKLGYGMAPRLRVLAYANGSWQTNFEYSLDTGQGSQPITTIQLLSRSNAAVSVRVVDGDGNSAVLTLRRGAPQLDVEVTRVADAGPNNILDHRLDKNTRFVITNGSTVLRDDVVTGATQTVAGSSLTEPYALLMDPGLPYLLMLGFASKPTTLFDDGSVLWRLESAGTNALVKRFSLHFLPWPWLQAGAVHVEAESMTLAGGATTTADAAASGGVAAVLDAQNEEAYFEFVAGRDLPLGDHTLVFRGLDSNQVTNDARLRVRSTTDAADRANATRTLTGAYAFHALDFSLTSADEGDTIRVSVLKDTATANAIRADYVLIVPRKRNASTPSHVHFPRDVARNALMATTSREAIRRA